MTKLTHIDLYAPRSRRCNVVVVAFAGALLRFFSLLLLFTLQVFHTFLFTL